MKTTIISKLLLAIALTISLVSFTSDKKNAEEKAAEAKRAGFAASLYQVSNTQKVKLSINTGEESPLRIILQEKNGKICYSELYRKNQGQKNQYRRVFDMAEMTDGTYYFKMYFKDHAITKELQLETNNDKIISIH